MTNCDEQFIYTEAVTLRLPYQIGGYATIAGLIAVDLLLLGATTIFHPPLAPEDVIYYRIGAICSVLFSAWSVIPIRSIVRAVRTKLVVTLRSDGAYVQMAATPQSITKLFSWNELQSCELLGSAKYGFIGDVTRWSGWRYLFGARSLSDRLGEIGSFPLRKSPLGAFEAVFISNQGASLVIPTNCPDEFCKALEMAVTRCQGRSFSVYREQPTFPVRSIVFWIFMSIFLLAPIGMVIIGITIETWFPRLKFW